MTLISDYDSSKLETVQRFFISRLQPKAYLFISNDLDDQRSTSKYSFRDQSRTNGKGAKLFDVFYLEKVKGRLDSHEEGILVSLPDGCTDLQEISIESDISSARLSALFSVVGLDPFCTYRRNGAKRPVNAYKLPDVDIVLKGVRNIYEKLETRRHLTSDLRA